MSLPTPDDFVHILGRASKKSGRPFTFWPELSDGTQEWRGVQKIYAETGKASGPDAVWHSVKGNEFTWEPDGDEINDPVRQPGYVVGNKVFRTKHWTFWPLAMVDDFVTSQRTKPLPRGVPKDQTSWDPDHLPTMDDVERVMAEIMFKTNLAFVQQRDVVAELEKRWEGVAFVKERYGKENSVHLAWADSGVLRSLWRSGPTLSNKGKAHYLQTSRFGEHDFGNKSHWYWPQRMVTDFSQKYDD